MIDRRTIGLITALAVLPVFAPVVEAAQTDLDIDALATGNHSFTAGGQTFNGYVRNDGGTGWLLVGRGREGWQFDNDGQGAVADVGNAAALGTVAGFTPVMYSDLIINDLISNSGIDLTDVEIRLRRATTTDGTGAYQEVRWRPRTQTTWDGEFDEVVGGSTGYDIEQAIVGGFAVNTTTRDTVSAGNNNQRVFTWSWSGHGNIQGFSYGNGVQGVNNNDANTFMWENGTEAHAIPYTEVYIRDASQVANELFLTPGTGSSAANFSSNINNTLNDPFFYAPDDPTWENPNTVYDGSRGFHGNEAEGVPVLLRYDLADGAHTTVGPEAIYVDLWGRTGFAGANDRDDDIDVILYNGDYVSAVATVEGLSIDNADGNAHVRATFNLGDGVQFDRIQVVGNDSGGGSNNNYFTLMEVAAAYESIPEPSSLALLALGGLCVLRRRRG